MKYPPLAPAALLLLLALPTAARPPKRGAPPPDPPPAARPLETLKLETSGAFRDAAGHSHPWTITQAHTLTWDGTPFLPVGGFWTPQAWQENAPADAANADRQYLDMLKAHGVFDICLSAGARGLSHVPPAVVQRTLDSLEAGGFHYGLEIADFPHDPLIGYVVKPGAYRNPAPPTTGVARFGRIPGLVDAVYMLVSTHDGEVDDTGDAQIDNDTALVTLKNSGPDDVLLLYPQKVYAPGTPESRLPDLWQGYDEYRDRLLTWFRRVKLGPGFRFFLDPLTNKLALNGEVDTLIPTTDGYRMDFGAWLDKKYGHNVDDLNRGWGIANRDLPDFTIAARCIPLWQGARGIPAIYDPVARTRYEVTNRPRIGGHLWQDIADFRTESVRGYMNAISDVLKKGVADAPVLYQWTGHTALFSNNRTAGGYDGLCMTPGDNSVLERGAYAYGQAEEAPKTTWLLAATDLPGARGPLLDTWDTLQGIGARGFFCQPLPAATAPAPLDWLNSYSAGLQVSASALAATKPRVLWYPATAGLDIGVQQLPGGIWWLPGFLPGQSITLGGDLSGYVLPDPGGRLPTYVVWSPRATLAQASFDLGKKANPFVTNAAGIPVKVKKDGDVYTVPVGPDPVLISRVNSLPLPVDAADAAQKEAKRLLALADDQKIADQSYKDQYFYATNSIPDTAGNADIRYSLLQRVLANLTEALRPYAWVEAENAAQYTFDAITPDPKASGGACLSLDTTLDPPPAASTSYAKGYGAQYRFSVNAPGRYEVWAATGPLGARTSSPFTWKVDDAPANDTAAAQSSGDLYASRFQWADLGGVTLTRGIHTLAVAVTGRRPSDGRYALALDAFCITRVPFTPDGPRKPPIDIPPPAPDDKGKKKK